jgi:hypothetical protein
MARVARTLAQHLLGSSQQASGENDDRRRSVTRLNVLRSRQLNQLQVGERRKDVSDSGTSSSWRKQPP